MKRQIYLLGISLFFLSVSLHAQILERPLRYIQIQEPSYFSKPEARSTQNTEAISLPFWDDFSRAGGFPDTGLWQNGTNVRISAGLGLAAPTINVAIFDGVNGNGEPYDAAGILSGLADELVSAEINLNVVEANQADSVFISFFWQVEGNGELPDAADSLTLQFKDTNGNWATFWRQAGGSEVRSDEFTQEVLQVPASYFHETFQFRFRAYARLSGPFDTWAIDYVYLNDSRFEGDIAYLDRALTRNPESLLNPYTAMPKAQFFANPSQYVTPTSIEFYNLNSDFQTITFSTIVRDLHTNSVVEVLNDEVPPTRLPLGFQRLTFDAPALNPTNLDASADSLLLETEFFIASGDVFFIEEIRAGNDTIFNEQIDYRVNDTTRFINSLDDFFAYDDGEPEFAAGINQNGGKLAYRFFAEERALLTHIDINFPFTQQAGEPIELMVWKSLDGREDSVMHRQTAGVLRPAFTGELRSYALDTPLFVQDTFYIGFEQGTDEFLAVGLDKNTNSGTEMFFNVRGIWQENEFVQGSFLMRPRFDRETAENFVPAEPAPAKVPDVFPNPTTGEIRISGAFDNIQIFDNWGQRAAFQLIQREDFTIIDLGQNQPGIYLLKFQLENSTLTKRIILNR